MKPEQGLTLRSAMDEQDIAQFWMLRDKYMNDDIIPNCDPPMSSDEKEWFFSDEYRAHMMGLLKRDIDPLRVMYLMKDGRYAGFVEYVIYNSEDGKCFIVEFCIEVGQRNDGLGRRFFKLLEAKLNQDGVTYFALNTSNKNNRKFWASLGFAESESDDTSNPVYIKTIEQINI